MLSAIRSRVTYVNVVATLVLVFAMTGGAYAAKKYLITSTKQISPSVLKALQGKNGAAGPAGTAGVAGAQGAQGPAGPAGAAGAKGETGPAGKDGAAGKTGATGKEGSEGPEGSPWAVGGTLPSGKTETGTWSFGKLAVAVEVMRLPLSFPVPLAANLEPADVHYINAANMEVLSGGSEVVSAVCTGSALVPSAVKGLCIYTKSLSGVSNLSNSSINKGGGGGGGQGALTVGAFLSISSPEEGAVGVGTWAVTAP